MVLLQKRTFFSSFSTCMPFFTSLVVNFSSGLIARFLRLLRRLIMFLYIGLSVTLMADFFANLSSCCFIGIRNASKSNAGNEVALNAPVTIRSFLRWCFLCPDAF